MRGNVKSRLLSVLLTMAMVCSLVTGLSVTAFGADKDILVLYTNDVHCGVDDSIGYAGLDLYKKEMLKQTPYVTLVDAGDAIQGAPIGTLSEGGYIIDIMNKVGYDVAIPGNHEFDYGMPRFMELAGKLSCGYNSCNFISKATGQPVFAPYKMLTYGDTRIAYVGISTPESFTKSTPAYFQDGAGNYLYSFCEDETGQSLYDRVQSSVDGARKDGADYVIAVGHLGENGVTDRWSSESVVKNTNGIDAFIDGHSHEVTPALSVKNKDGKEVTVTQTGTKLNNIGKMTIKPDGTIETELISEVPAMDAAHDYIVQNHDTLSRIAKRELGSYDRWNDIYNHNLDKLTDPDKLPVGLSLLIPGNSGVNEKGKNVDYAADQYIKGIQSRYNETLKTVLGTTPYLLTVNDPDTGRRRIRSGETNLGDLTADAYRIMLGADIGLSNGGGIRSDIKPGNITYNDTLAVFPFGNMVCVLEVPGQKLLDALEMAARDCPEENGGFLQVSGLSYTIDTRVKASVKMDDKGNFISVDGAYRVSDVKVNGEPIDLNKNYTVASHNYMLKAGGDGMTMFKGCRVVKDDVMVDVDTLSAYIKSLGGSVTGDYANPAGQGRITVK